MQENSVSQDAYAHAIMLSKQKGLRMTQLRRRVLALIIRASTPLSAYALVALYNETESSITATTVYRALDFLEEHGLVHRLASKNAYVSCITPGHSLNCQFWICQNCHVVSEMHSQSVTQSIENCATTQNFLMQGQIVEVFGLCQLCR